MKDFYGRMIPIGDPPSTLQRVLRNFMGRCKKCGSKLESTKVRGRHKRIHTVYVCERCGYRCSSKKRR